MATYVLLLLTALVIVTVAALQYLPLVVLPDRDGHGTRVVTMWGHQVRNEENLVYWTDGAEPKTELTSLGILGAAVLLFIALLASLLSGSGEVSQVLSEAPSTVDELAETEKNSDESGKDITPSAVVVSPSLHAVAVGGSVRANGDEESGLHLFSVNALVWFLSTVMLCVGGWCLYTFHEKWSTRSGDRFREGYFVLVLLTIPAIVLIWLLAGRATLRTCHHGLSTVVPR